MIKPNSICENPDCQRKDITGYVACLGQNLCPVCMAQFFYRHMGQTYTPEFLRNHMLEQHNHRVIASN